ncbi:MAG: arsenite efflux transporter metallochaperone ArsD [Negativicutes bacterium]|nr:arsenite efflux transporter metallochaperone ArsD [Negativicutes bacterium]
MKKIEIFDPAMCCETGICGPSIDQELLSTATLIQTLKDKGVDIVRYGLANNPQKFVENKVVNDLLQLEGVEILPLVLVAGNVVKKNSYPTKEEFLAWINE